MGAGNFVWSLGGLILHRARRRRNFNHPLAAKTGFQNYFKPCRSTKANKYLKQEIKLKKFILSDLHIGHKDAQYDVMDEAIAYIKKEAHPGD